MIAHLSKRHDRAGFDSGVAEMNIYLRQQARQDAEKGLSRTFVHVADATSATIQGFYALAFALLAFEEIPHEKRLSRYPAPVALLAQLAVDVRFQKQGLGERLLFDALARADEASGRIGCTHWSLTRARKACSASMNATASSARRANVECTSR